LPATRFATAVNVGFSAPSFNTRLMGLLRNATAAENGANTTAKPFSHPAKNFPCSGELKMPSRMNGCNSIKARSSSTTRTNPHTVVQREPISAAHPLISCERQRPHRSNSDKNAAEAETEPKKWFSPSLAVSHLKKIGNCPGWATAI
jgi:hypothetical protein